MLPILKHPSAWLPIAMSLTMLAFILALVAIYGVPAPEADVTSCVGTCGRPDEGVGAHLFQIWLVLEFLMIGFFGLKWLPRAPKDALLILAIQIVAVIAACAPVRILRL